MYGGGKGAGEASLNHRQETQGQLEDQAACPAGPKVIRTLESSRELISNVEMPPSACQTHSPNTAPLKGGGQQRAGVCKC